MATSKDALPDQDTLSHEERAISTDEGLDVDSIVSFGDSPNPSTRTLRSGGLSLRGLFSGCCANLSMRKFSKHFKNKHHGDSLSELPSYANSADFLVGKGGDNKLDMCAIEEEQADTDLVEVQSQDYAADQDEGKQLQVIEIKDDGSELQSSEEDLTTEESELQGPETKNAPPKLQLSTETLTKDCEQNDATQSSVEIQEAKNNVVQELNDTLSTRQAPRAVSFSMETTSIIIDEPRSQQSSDDNVPANTRGVADLRRFFTARWAGGDRAERPTDSQQLTSTVQNEEEQVAKEAEGDQVKAGTSDDQTSKRAKRRSFSSRVRKILDPKKAN